MKVGDRVTTPDGKTGTITDIVDTRFGPLARLDGVKEVAYAIPSLKSAERPKPRVKLVGANGNVFNIIGLCKVAARRAGWSKEEIDRFVQEAFNQRSYDNVLQLVMQMMEVE